ncbi:MAG: helix-turn-helix domain-containing protein [Proteobacteria bacterium]|nr:helix-turn-helix domain-containing protein [Pseudomonadota bacterium]
MNETLGVGGAADFLKISKDAVKRKARNGEIPGAKIGKCWVFIEEDLIETIRRKYPCQYINQKERVISILDSASVAKKLADRVAQLTGEKPKNMNTH